MKAGRSASALVLGLVFFAMACGSAAAAPGDLDRFFGQEGIVRFQNPSNASIVPMDLAIGPDDSIYALRREVKCNGAGCTARLLVSRHDSRGLLEPSFGSSGVVSLGPFHGEVGLSESSLALAPDGKAVIGTVDDGDLVLVRLDADGGLDSTFGIAGVAKAAMGTPIFSPKVAIQSDGRIVVGTESQPGYGEGAVIVARYTAQGGSDATFNAGAPLFTSLGFGIGGLDLFGNGRIALASPRCCQGSSGVVHVGVLAASGAFDSGFGSHGHRFLDDVATSPKVADVLALPKGRIDVVGGGDKVMFALRLLPSGRLDPHFGSRGVAYMKRSELRVAGAAVDGSGRLAIAGFSPGGRYYQSGLAVLRRRANGRPDRTFGGGAPVRPELSAEESQATVIGVQSGDRIVVLGEAGNCERACPPPTSLLLRFLGGSSGARCAGRRATIVGTRGSDRLIGTARRDVIAALSGDDVVRGRGGNDLICGNGGNDRLSGGGGRDRLLGGSGNDRAEP